MSVTWVRFSCDSHTPLEHGLTVVTRNVRHFEPTGVPIVDPTEYTDPSD